MITTTTLPLARRAPDHELAVGEPRFADPQLAELARRDGQAAAWHRAAATIDGLDGAVRAAAGVDGPFAVGLADARGRVFLAVDRFAVRSLCWRLVGGRLLFAERADALAAAEPAAPLSPQAIYDYLYFHAIPSPHTVFQGVFRLPPGHCAWYDGQTLEIRRYWEPRFEEPAAPDFDALARGFRSRLREAVAGELDGSKPGCFLSGGTDSSTVAGMIKDIAGRAATYSIGFEAEGYDEMAFARIAAKRFGTEHHEYYVTPADLVRSIPEVARHYDQPFGNSSALPAYYCAKMAREDGVTRLLAGDGGDELYGGNARYAKQRIFGWYDAVPGVLRRGLLEPLLEGTPIGALPLARKGRSYVEQAKVPLPDRMQMYNLLLRLGTADVFTPDFLAQVDAEEPLRHQRAVWREAGGAGALNRMLAYDWRYTLAESDLPKVCGSTSLAGVAVAFPFLERGVVDFSLALPTEYKLKGLKLRWFFKEALRGFLPDEIITKPKHGFGLPFGVWASRDPKLSAFAAESVRGLVERGVLRQPFVETLLRERLPENPGYYGEMVWISMMLEQWLRHHAPGFRVG